MEVWRWLVRSTVDGEMGVAESFELAFELLRVSLLLMWLCRMYCSSVLEEQCLKLSKPRTNC